MALACTTSKKVLAETGVNPDIRVRDLTEDDLTKLRDYIQKQLESRGRPPPRGVPEREAPDGDWLLPRPSSPSSGLPVRGQRTHTNARTRKGPRKQIGGKKK